jgi:hypothetical protein
MFRAQGLKTLRFNMASPELLKKMGLAATDEIGISDFDGRCWDREDVNHVREVVAHEVLLVRRFGVTDCPRLDEYIMKHTPKPIATMRISCRLHSNLDYVKCSLIPPAFG